MLHRVLSKMTYLIAGENKDCCTFLFNTRMEGAKYASIFHLSVTVIENDSFNYLANSLK